jgi:hypothetical protein
MRPGLYSSIHPSPKDHRRTSQRSLLSWKPRHDQPLCGDRKCREQRYSPRRGPLTGTIIEPAGTAPLPTGRVGLGDGHLYASCIDASGRSRLGDSSDFSAVAMALANHELRERLQNVIAADDVLERGICGEAERDRP